METTTAGLDPEGVVKYGALETERHMLLMGERVATQKYIMKFRVTTSLGGMW